MQLTVWAPVIVLFLSAIIAAVVKRNTKDLCLKFVHRSRVYLKFKTGRWYEGELRVFSNAIEIRYTEPAPLASGLEKRTYLLYEHDLEGIQCILRPSPAPGTREHNAWLRDVNDLRHPTYARIFLRKVRNAFNMLRDAFAQSITMIFGTVKKAPWIARFPIADDKVGEVGRNLIAFVPNSYEPVLEEYLGHEVVVETALPDKTLEQVGTLQEYTGRFLFIRDMVYLLEMPPEVPPDARQRYDAVFPRPAFTIRHLVCGPEQKNT